MVTQQKNPALRSAFLFITSAGLPAVILKDGNPTEKSCTAFRFFFLSLRLASKLAASLKKKNPLSRDFSVVGVAGFEPATSCSQSRRDEPGYAIPRRWCGFGCGFGCGCECAFVCGCECGCGCAYWVLEYDLYMAKSIFEHDS